MKDKASNIDPKTTLYKPPALYPIHNGSSQQLQSMNFAEPSKAKKIGRQQSLNNGGPVQLTGAVLPAGFEHYMHCSCYAPKPGMPKPTMEMAEIEQMSELGCRRELAQMCEAMRKMRVFMRTKEMLTKQRYQNEINTLKKQLSNNSYMWDKMSQQETNEKVLKQELLYTQ